MTARFALLSLLIWLAAPVAAQTTLIVSRNAEVTAIYIAGPADDLVDALDLELDLTTNATFADGQQAATAAFQALAERVRITAAGAPTPVSPAVALLHLADDPLPFATPFEASIATAVCATPDAALPGPDDLRLYGGVFAEVPLAEPDIALSLDVSEPLSVVVRVFHRGTLIAEYRAMMEPDRPLVLRNSRGLGPWALLIGSAIMVVVILGLALILSRSARSLT